MDSKIKRGKYYWKLNVDLLDDDEVCHNFSLFWQHIRNKISNYDNINQWWEYFAKKKIKTFFILEGKRISSEKFGLINHLEFRLRKLYNNLDASGNLDYQQVKDLKDMIDNLKLKILNGIKVRSRVQEASLGEIPSSYLLGKLKSNNNKKLITKLIAENNIDDAFTEGDVLDETDKINEYVYKYYRKLYSEIYGDEDIQIELLNLIDSKVNEEDNDLLTEEITIFEIEKNN